MAKISLDEGEFVARAVAYLERPSFLIRAADLVGAPLESLVKVVPPWVSQTVERALHRAMQLAATSIPARPPEAAVPNLHQLEMRAFWSGYRHAATTAVSGCAAGLVGLSALPWELPLTTCLMLRSMAVTAAQFGEDVQDPRVRLECLSLFSMGGPSRDDDDMDSAYLTARVASAALVSRAVKFLLHSSPAEVTRSLANGTAPTLLRLISAIAGRFEIVATQKALLQSLPVVGAVMAASLNVAFTDHFNTVARYHFGLRYLERRHGSEAIHELYRQRLADLRRPPSVPAIGAQRLVPGLPAQDASATCG